jgi:hypothetical protein
MGSAIHARALGVVLTASVCAGFLNAQAALELSGGIAGIPYEDAKPILDVLREDLLPAELGFRTPAEREALWPAWVARRDGEIRARLAQADEDSVLNLLLLGTRFTARPRVTDLASLRAPGTVADLVGGRLDDLIASLGSPAADERLRFAREVIARRGIDLETLKGRRQAREHLLEILARVISETESFVRSVEAMAQLDDPAAKLSLNATLYRDRGLSSDTSVVSNFALDQTFQELKAAGTLKPGAVRRVAIVGPGLDIVDKREGHDFYPMQTMQPFGVADSLTRLGLAASDLRVTTFDLSPRVNDHLAAARQRARTGTAYLLHLPLGAHERWRPELVSYWERFGSSVGEETQPAASPVGAGVRVRAIHVRPATVAAIVPQDLNIVVQRLEPIAPGDRFDLVIATNVLVYYDLFDQSLAAANLAKMLRPGGLVLSNTLIVELPRSPLGLVGYTDVVYTESAVGDRILWYGRVSS